MLNARPGHRRVAVPMARAFNLPKPFAHSMNTHNNTTTSCDNHNDTTVIDINNNNNNNNNGPSERRVSHKRRPRAAWVVVLFFAAVFATVFVFVATLTSMHTPSLRTPALIAPSAAFKNKSEISLAHQEQRKIQQQQQQQQLTQPQLPIEQTITTDITTTSEKVPSSQTHPSTTINQVDLQTHENTNEIAQPISVPTPPKEQQPSSIQVDSSNDQTWAKSSSSSDQDNTESLHPAPDFPHRCYVQPPLNDADAEDWFYPFNARSLCLTSSICFQPSTPTESSKFYPAASLEQTKCANVTPSFENNSNQNFNCSQLQSTVHCGHGRYIPPRTPDCPSTQPMSSISTDKLATARWLDGIVFFVPAFPHMGNIFHFSFAAGAISQIVSAIPKIVSQWRGNNVKFPDPIPVTVMLRGGSLPTFGGWQTGVLNLIINHRLQHRGLRVSLATMNESVIGDPERKLRSTQLTCAKSAILLGTRSHINLWPFPSYSWPDLNGNAVPSESIAFRRAAYDAVGISSILPHVPAGAVMTSEMVPKGSILFDLPPRAIGYSRRNSDLHPDFTKERPYQEGTIRRFSDADEKWFVNMLKETAARHNFSYTTLEASADMKFDQQVQLYANVGFVAGIHGANLMNAIFMKPFGALMEVFAKGAPLHCYIAGANSGLWYRSHEPVRKASSEESGCAPHHITCKTLSHTRRVMIDSEQDRVNLTRYTEQAIDRIEMLHRTFGARGGIPVVYNVETSMFRIDWNSV